MDGWGSRDLEGLGLNSQNSGESVKQENGKQHKCIHACLFMCSLGFGDFVAWGLRGLGFRAVVRST